MRHIRRLILLAILLILAAVFFPSIRRGAERVYYPLEYSAQIRKAADRYGVDPYLVTAVVFEESRFDPAVRSKVGAVGLMQVMPETGKWVALKQGRSFSQADLVKPDVNVDMGTWYLSFLLKKYGKVDLALAAYNGGLMNVDRWMSSGQAAETTVRQIPYKETRDFVVKVKKSRSVYRELYPGAFK
jgi:soluble lytic murein transglycosylase